MFNINFYSHFKTSPLHSVNIKTTKMEISVTKTSPSKLAISNSEGSSEYNCSDEEDPEKNISLLDTSHARPGNIIQYKTDHWHRPGESEYGDDERDIKVELDLGQPNGRDFVNYYSSQYSGNDAANFRVPRCLALQHNYNSGQQTAPIITTQQKHLTTTATTVTHHPHPDATNDLASSSYHRNPIWSSDSPQYNGGNHYYSPYDQNRYSHYKSFGSTSNPSADVHHLSSSGREARNRAEKNRRDKLNGSIQELSTMVPHVAESPRRVDKTAVLRFAAHGLRLQYVFRDTLNFARPQLTDPLMKLLDSFFITLTCHGQIILISSSIEQHLGHCQTDLYGQNIFNITHPEDHDLMRQQLIPTDLENLIDTHPHKDSDGRTLKTQLAEAHIDKIMRDDRRCFTVRLARAGPRSEPPSYELVKIDGCFRRSDSAPSGLYNSSPPSGYQLLRRTHRRDEAIPLLSLSGNDIVLVAVARVVRSSKLIKRIIEANRLEYKTRHLIDGRIVDCDQRIGIVAGYMTDEVRNLSPFTFMHQDDVRWAIVALKQMYDCVSYGESTYRLITRNGCFIYLQSKGYLEIDRKTNTVHSFVCVNTLLDEEEGKCRLQEMKDKFSIVISKQDALSAMDVPAAENPQQLVNDVLCLLENLQKTSSSDEEVASSLFASDSLRPLSVYSSRTSLSSNTPPLALVPPEPSSVQISISKSVDVVSVAARKHLKQRQVSANNLPIIDGGDIDLLREDSAQAYCCSCQYQFEGVKCSDCANTTHESKAQLKRSLNTTENKDFKLTKRRLKNNDQLGPSLLEKQNSAINLNDRSDMYELSETKTRVETLMEEYQRQNEMFLNISTEIQSDGIGSNRVEAAQLTDAQAVVEFATK